MTTELKEIAERIALTLEDVGAALKPLATYAAMRLKEADELEAQRRADWRGQKLSSQRGATCPFCNSTSVHILMRGSTIFGCLQCVPSFVYSEAAKAHVKVTP